MGDDHLRSAVDRLDSAAARIEAALAHRADTRDAALIALQARHEALRKVLADSVHELDTLLAAAEPPADGS